MFHTLRWSTSHATPLCQSMNGPTVLIRARLADALVVHPFGRGALPAILAGLKRREPRLARALDQRRQRREQSIFRQPAPFQYPQAPRRRGELEGGFPRARVLED